MKVRHLKPIKKPIIRCKSCLISEKFPGIYIDENQVCNLCHEFNADDYNNNVTNSNKEKINKVIEERKGTALYDVLVAYSGGKDSSFTLYYFREVLKLKVLALLIDNDFISERAHKNAKILTNSLKIDLIVFKPEADFMHNLYNKSLEGSFYNMNQLSRANAACLSCINLINNVALNEAIMRKIPMIAGGYIGGQIPDQGGVVSLDRKLFKQMREKNTEMLSKKIDERISTYLTINEADDNQIFPILLNPLLGLNYSEKEIIKVISKYGWIKPDDTGMSSSNCIMNDFAISVHYEKYQYHSYEAEICLQVRKGTMDKEEAIERLTDIKPSNEFKDIKKKLKSN